MVASKQTWASSLATAVIAVIVGVVLLLQSPRPTDATHVGEIVLGVIVIATLLVIAGLVVGIRRDGPHLKFGDPDVIERKIVIFGSSTGHEKVAGSVPTITTRFIATPVATGSMPLGVFAALDEEIGKAYFVYVPVVNESLNNRRQRQAATAITAHLYFVQTDGSETHVKGRWADPPDTQREAITMNTQRVALIPATDEPEYLDVALKYADDNSCYVFNDENRSHSQDLRFRELPDPLTIVRVEIHNEGKTLVGEFDLRHDGKGSQPTLTQRPEWRRTARHPIRGVRS